MTKIKGMDISNYQGKVTKKNFQKAKDYGISYVILKSGYTGYSRYECKADNAFEYNYKKAKAAGFPVGIYYYSLANGPKSVTAEAKFVIKQLKGKEINCPVYLDMEDSAYRMYQCSKKQLAEIANTWCKLIRKAGYIPGIYASTSWFNNKIGKITEPHTKWVAQYYKKCEYKGDYDIWQYSSSESVPGIGKRVDVNWAYKKPWEITVGGAQAAKPTEEQAPAQKTKEKKGYPGKFPKLRVIKTTQEVIDDAVAWGKMIAKDNRFHYGYTNKHGSSKSSKWSPNAHHNGCYFCGTNGKQKNGMVDKEFTYCCNPFVHACWAHGGLIPKALTICKDGSSWDFHKGCGYDRVDLFKNLGHINMKSLKKGDVLCKDSHVALFVGWENGKAYIVDACSGDDNKRNSKKWNDSIRVRQLTASSYKSFPRVHRFVKTVDFTHNICRGDISDDVKKLQAFLNWYGNYKLSEDRKFMDDTYKALVDFQKKNKLTPDGVCGKATLEKMKSIKK